MEVIQLKEVEHYNNMRKQISAVIAWYKNFSIKFNTEPTLITEDRYLMRHELMREENQEYLDACKDGDMIEIADALGDMLYILCGTIIEHGMQDKLVLVFDEIHRSNTSKLGLNGKPVYREDGKILKGPHYFKPNLKQFFEKEM